MGFITFDSIGVPTYEEMIDEYTSPEKWQEEKTSFWINKILNEHKNKKVIIEGQVDLKFIIDAFSKYDFTEYKIILLDCDEEVMCERVIENRKQSYLIDDDMKNWLKYLRNQAKELDVIILNTSNKTIEEIIYLFKKIIFN